MNKKIQHDFPLIEVEWADHYSEFDDGHTLDEVIEMVNTPCVRQSSGYLIAENKRQIAIAGTVEEDGTYSEIFVCMKRSILYRSDRDKNNN